MERTPTPPPNRRRAPHAPRTQGQVSLRAEERPFPPVCLWCAWWKPGEKNHCTAYPSGGRYPIPPALYRGEVSEATGWGHLEPLPHDNPGGGAHLLFRLHPAADNPDGWAAWARALPQMAAKAKALGLSEEDLRPKPGEGE